METRKEYNHRYYLEHKGAFKDKAARWAENNREKCRECVNRHYEKNRERILAYKKEHPKHKKVNEVVE